MAYHTKKIKKGIFGEFSKIEEEFEELKDANAQSNKILEICELCDLIGAIEEYIKINNLTIDDLVKMKELTRHSFIDGSRK